MRTLRPSVMARLVLFHVIVRTLAAFAVVTMVAPALTHADGYRTTYLALAQERFADAGTDTELAPTDRDFELYGIEPSLGVVRVCLADFAPSSNTIATASNSPTSRISRPPIRTTGGPSIA